MPKMKDLGINVIPETMRPPEIGGGGGWGCTGTTCGGISCTGITNPCIGCTQNLTWCVCTEPSPCGSCTQQITACICTDLSACGSCTQQITACICTDLSACGTRSLCGFCSAAISACRQASCACSAVASICTGGSPTVITIRTGTPQELGGGGLTRENIAQLREQLNQQLQALDEAEKNLGPQTVEAIDAREREIQQELEQLKARRASLKK